MIQPEIERTPHSDAKTSSDFGFEVYDWWRTLACLVDPERHQEAVTVRPLPLHSIVT
jgi:hypothetical protein